MKIRTKWQMKRTHFIQALKEVFVISMPSLFYITDVTAITEYFCGVYVIPFYGTTKTDG